ncbi:MAG TPA: hypothetical protein P5079_07690, partial [Elusimicrobiota bacterium]|nr:hypothetical protein [Elusimicrobiota bacterium]
EAEIAKRKAEDEAKAKAARPAEVEAKAPTAELSPETEMEIQDYLNDRVEREKITVRLLDLTENYIRGQIAAERDEAQRAKLETFYAGALKMVAQDRQYLKDFNNPEWLERQIQRDQSKLATSKKMRKATREAVERRVALFQKQLGLLRGERPGPEVEPEVARPPEGEMDVPTKADRKRAGKKTAAAGGQRGAVSIEMLLVLSGAGALVLLAVPVAKIVGIVLVAKVGVAIVVGAALAAGVYYAVKHASSWWSAARDYAGKALGRVSKAKAVVSDAWRSGLKLFRAKTTTGPRKYSKQDLQQRMEQRMAALQKEGADVSALAKEATPSAKKTGEAVTFRGVMGTAWAAVYGRKSWLMYQLRGYRIYEFSELARALDDYVLQNREPLAKLYPYDENQLSAEVPVIVNIHWSASGPRAEVLPINGVVALPGEKRVHPEYLVRQGEGHNATALDGTVAVDAKLFGRRAIPGHFHNHGDLTPTVQDVVTGKHIGVVLVKNAQGIVQAGLYQWVAEKGKPSVVRTHATLQKEPVVKDFGVFFAEGMGPRSEKLYLDDMDADFMQVVLKAMYENEDLPSILERLGISSEKEYKRFSVMVRGAAGAGVAGTEGTLAVRDIPNFVRLSVSMAFYLEGKPAVPAYILQARTDEILRKLNLDWISSQEAMERLARLRSDSAGFQAAIYEGALRTMPQDLTRPAFLAAVLQRPETFAQLSSSQQQQVLEYLARALLIPTVDAALGASNIQVRISSVPMGARSRIRVNEAVSMENGEEKVFRTVDVLLQTSTVSGESRLFDYLTSLAHELSHLALWQGSRYPAGEGFEPEDVEAITAVYMREVLRGTVLAGLSGNDEKEFLDHLIKHSAGDEGVLQLWNLRRLAGALTEQYPDKSQRRAFLHWLFRTATVARLNLRQIAADLVADLPSRRWALPRVMATNGDSFVRGGVVNEGLLFLMNRCFEEERALNENDRQLRLVILGNVMSPADLSVLKLALEKYPALNEAWNNGRGGRLLLLEKDAYGYTTDKNEIDMGILFAVMPKILNLDQRVLQMGLSIFTDREDLWVNNFRQIVVHLISGTTLAKGLLDAIAHMQIFDIQA